MSDPTSTAAALAPIDATDLVIAGEVVPGEGPAFDLLDKFTLSPIARIGSASPAQIEAALGAAESAFASGAPSPYERGAILERAVALVAERRADFVRTMQREAGFTASDANGEVTRCLETLRLSAEEARRLSGDVIPLAGAPGQAGRMAFTMRVPLGIVVAITPFNSPLNTVCHKIAPSFAAGNATILKPSSYTPRTAYKLVEALRDAGMPQGFLSLLQGSADVARHLLDDPRVAFYAFTGSTEVGKAIQAAAGLRRTQMELGSIAFTILGADADLDRALPRVVAAAYRKAGQVCTSVQRLLVHESIRAEAEARLVPLVEGLVYGDPSADTTVVGPMIAEKEAVRVERWIEDAVAGGATALVGGRRHGAVVPPTLLKNTRQDMTVSCREVFGPVMSIASFATLREAVDTINATPYGLATGFFTNRLDDAFVAARTLRVGGVHINETSSSRVDLMPYGGSKESGFGREGPHYAVEEMTEERIITITA